ncbi:MAG: quinone-dependent dihydroorotate dehydrogenase [Leptospira sp.]|nr:quinone-dependent dihydroorotate dehydrogenase [Leptospira sp.]
MVRDHFYSLFLKPLFFSLDPENAHQLSVSLLKAANQFPGFLNKIEQVTTYKSERLKVKVAGIEFSNPLGMAAGFDKTGELYPFLAKLGFGHVEIGTITGEKQPGNPQPRVFRYPKDQALINRMGFNNPGSKEALCIISTQKKFIPRGINAGKTKIVPAENAVEDYVKTFQSLSGVSDYGVINVSSPNTPGLRNLQEKDALVALVNGIRKGLGGKFLIPTFVKLAPDLEENAFLELLDIVLDLGISGLVLTNTTLDKSSLTGYSRIEEGGLSGRPVREKSTGFIRLAYKKLQGRLPIIGVGGIDSGESALEKIKAGANLIQIYTGYIYQGPFLPYNILKFLDNFMLKEGVGNISQLTGSE